MAEKAKKKFSFPHTFVLIFFIAMLAAVLANIVPAGVYDRVLDEATGRMVVEADSFHYVDKIGCSPFEFFAAFPTGFVNTADIFFFIIFAYFFVRMLMKNGTFDALVGWALRTAGDNVQIIIPLCMTLFGILGSTIGMFEETYGMIPVFMALGIAMGFDGIVGASIVYIAVAVGFASATINPFTIGVAQPIADVAYPSGTGFRVFCFVVFLSTSIIYVWRYANKIRKDPMKSYLYGEKNNFSNLLAGHEELMKTKFNRTQKLSCVIFVATLVILLVGTMKFGWYIGEISTLFLIMGILTGLVSGWSGGEISNSFVAASQEMQQGCMVVGISRSIQVIMDNASITDTIIHALANALNNVSGVFSAVGMLFVQNIINFFIPSGSGQAVVTMPILAPLSDLVGVSRQIAVLAFQFGDGFSNIFWPTSVFMMCGIMQVPINKWYRYVTPLFLILFAEQILLIMLACTIGYH